MRSGDTESRSGPSVSGGVIALAAAVLIAAGSPTAAAAELFALDDGRAVAPFTLMLGDEGNWALPVPDAPEPAASGSGALSIEPEDGGGLRATWNGQAPAQIYLQAAEPMDISALTAADAALVLLLKVNRPPGGDVELRMACGYPCQAAADVTRLFEAIPVDRWGTVSFSLSCFTDEGLQTDRVDAPFVLATSGEFSVSLRQIAVLEGMAGQATVRCD
jgi:hypothetical protein